jgi:N-acetylneuraminic acid mutarotase
MNKLVTVILLLFFISGLFVATFNPVSALVLVEDTWYTITPMSHSRHSFETVAVDGTIYAIGGGAGSNFLSTNERYDPKTDKWTTLASMPTPRSNFIIVDCQGKIYCMGGTTTNDGTVTAPPIPPPSPPTSTVSGTTSNYDPVYTPVPPLSRQIDVVEVYDPVTNMWESKKSLPVFVEGMQAQVVNGQIFIITPSGELYMYNSITDKWSSKTSLPVDEEPLQTLVVNEHLFVITQSALYMYDPVTDTWINKTSMPASMTFAFSVVMDNKIIVGDLFNVSEILFYNMYCAQLRVNIYDPIADVWQVGKTTAEHLFVLGFTLGVTSNVYASKNVYVFGREAPKDDPLNVQPFTLVYDPVDNVWSTAKIAAAAPYTMRTMVVVDDVFYVIGGSAYHVKYVPVAYHNTQEYPDTPLHVVTPAPSPSFSSSIPSTSDGSFSHTTHEPGDVWPVSMMLVVAAAIVLTLCIVVATLFFYQGSKRNKRDKHE